MKPLYNCRDRTTKSTQESKFETLKLSPTHQPIQKANFSAKGFKSQKVVPCQFLKLKINDKTLKKYSFQKNALKFTDLERKREFVISDKDS